MHEIKKLVEKGKSQGYVSRVDFNNCLAIDDMMQEHIDDIIQMLNDMGIEVRMEKAEVIKLKNRKKDE